jgi:hypothetical protein
MSAMILAIPAVSALEYSGDSALANTNILKMSGKTTYSTHDVVTIEEYTDKELPPRPRDPTVPLTPLEYLEELEKDGYDITEIRYYISAGDYDTAIELLKEIYNDFDSDVCQ